MVLQRGMRGEQWGRGGWEMRRPSISKVGKERTWGKKERTSKKENPIKEAERRRGSTCCIAMRWFARRPPVACSESMSTRGKDEARTLYRARSVRSHIVAQPDVV